MNVLLILREEIVCALILIFLMLNQKAYGKKKQNKYFYRLCFWALAHIVFDGITVYTANNRECVSAWLNEGVHYIFYFVSLFFCFDYFKYTLDIVFHKREFGKKNILLWAPNIVYFLFVPFLEIEYKQGKGTYYSGGPAVMFTYAIVMVYIILCLALIIRHRQEIARNVYCIWLVCILTFLCGVVIQCLIPEILFIGGLITIVVVGVYFSLENPIRDYRKKAYEDGGTGLYNRNAYDEKIAEFEERYAVSFGYKKFSCVVLDANFLKQTNDTYGHEVGDELIQKVAEKLNEHLKSAYGIYRIGGDEFAAFYMETEKEIIQQEVDSLQAELNATYLSVDKKISVAIGWAQADRYCKEIRDVIRMADERMYENKFRMKEQQNGRND